jgi:hypothetical protein
MNALKAIWTVTGGILLGEAADEYTKEFTYTSKMYDEDRDGGTHFQDLLMEAHDYSTTLTNPGFVNWVKLEFVWI